MFFIKVDMASDLKAPEKSLRQKRTKSFKI